MKKKSPQIVDTNQSLKNNCTASFCLTRNLPLVYQYFSSSSMDEQLL